MHLILTELTNLISLPGSSVDIAGYAHATHKLVHKLSSVLTRRFPDFSKVAQDMFEGKLSAKVCAYCG